MRSIEEILKLVCVFLNEEKVTYVVVGGLADFKLYVRRRSKNSVKYD